ncbi:phage terminase large subunit [Arsenophonus nasoniae]|uniref:Phage terminase large subunit n=1 Tax=Arsenophonus nasoniae TaxID=638 RepID=A0AA95GZS0_9GAMM|nr:phage terminase large subunit [Arsenophonus nasoniae]WGM03775.1 phage terminase large subunit [Arsenophonus nasoniae]WGM03827.1 phage terminase large subunit [Arsenophonus nasoniae]WGM03887.1 phage terminase large subunit [Arsenophonus nasoniae]
MKKNAFKEAVRRELARQSFINFVSYTKTDFIRGWFNEKVAKELEQFYQDVIDGKQPRLLIMAPPRSGKSELFSRRFPAWAFGKNPDIQIIATSYSADLSSRMNRDVQKIIDDEKYVALFRETRLNNKNMINVSTKPTRNCEMFEIVGKQGAYRSAGVGGGITGMGADIAIIDDPVKDGKEANSATIREAIWDWYTSTLYTRLSPCSGILLGMTRWHEDDLAGRLIEDMKQGGDYWKIVRFPAIAEEQEEHRKEGEALHPERFSTKHLLKIKKAVGSHTWNALFQQRPTGKGGDILRGDWLKRYTVAPQFKKVGVYADTALKTKEVNDYSVLLLAAVAVDGGMYILDILRGKWEGFQLEQKTVDFWNKHKHLKPHSLMIEDKASGTGLIQSLKKKQNIPVRSAIPNKDKYTRVIEVQGYFESGYIHIPQSADWVSEFIKELESFTATNSHKHDDQVDTVVMAVNDLIANPRVSFLDTL